MSYTTKFFAERTVRNGRVKIGGKWFAPKSDVAFPYDGRLDGKRITFGRYRKPTSTGIIYDTFVSMVGERIIDANGCIRWLFWNEVNND